MNLRLSRTSVKSGIVEHTKKEGLIQTNLVPRGVTKANPVPRFGCQMRFVSPDVAIPQTTTRWPERKLDDETVISPHGNYTRLLSFAKPTGGVWNSTMHDQFGGIARGAHENPCA